MAKMPTPSFKNSLKTNKHIALFIYLLPCPAACVPVTS